MREVKYRAWAKETNCFLPVFEIDFHAKMVGVWDCGKEDCGLCDNYLFFHEVEIVEYTGLKDKNGVEIYDGDLVDFWGRKFLVVYNLGGFGCFGLNEKWLPLGDVIYRPAIVIGNRFENPELLEEEKTC